MPSATIETVVLSANDGDNERFCTEVHEKLNASNVFAMSVQGGGGCGKTTLIESVVNHLKADRKCAVIEGDGFSCVDGERIAALGVPVVQINTEGGCHLSASMIHEVLPKFDLDSIDILLIENIGNLHYTARFPLGEHRRIACLSASGGLQMVDKYPALFRSSHLNLITKSDLANYVRFDIPRAVSKLHQVNATAKVLVTDAYSGDGVDVLCRCIRREMDDIACSA